MPRVSLVVGSYVAVDAVPCRSAPAVTSADANRSSYFVSRTQRELARQPLSSRRGARGEVDREVAAAAAVLPEAT